MNFQMHVGVLAFPFGTHVVPLLALVRNLAAALPGIKFSFFSTSSSNRALFSGSERCRNIQAYDVWDGAPEGRPLAHLEAMEAFLNAGPVNFVKVIGKVEEESGMKICCLLTDAFLWFAGDLAAERGVPWVPFWTAASCSLSAHLYTDSIQEAMGSNGAAGEDKVSLIPGMPSVRFSDLPPEIFHIQSSTPLAATIYKMVQKLPKSAAVVLNSFEEIDPIITKDLKSKFRHFLNIGPLCLSSPSPPPATSTGAQNDDCLSWLDSRKPKSVVYIGFGTVITPPENELAALAEALEACAFPFLWSLKDQAAELLPEGFRERTKTFGKIVPWAPQLQVLAHGGVGVVVTHGGWNSVLESISNGVPMICRPFFGDQKVNSRMVEDEWKIGVKVGGGIFTKGSTIEALNCVMSSQTIRENVEKLKDKAVKAVESEKGSSVENFSTLLEVLSCTNEKANGH